MSISKFGVGDLVRENIAAWNSHTGERQNPPDLGTIMEWSQDGWLVDFPVHGNIFWMNPNNLEVVSESR